MEEKNWGLLVLDHYTMALVNLPHKPLTGGILCELSSNSTQDAVLILFLYFYFFLNDFGDGTHNSGQSAIGFRWVKGEHNMAPTGEEASEWKTKHTRI